MVRHQYTVYCAHPAGDFTPLELTEGILSTDLRALIESEGIEAAYIDSALEEFVIENTRGTGFSRFRICYLPGRVLPIDVDHWQPPVEAISILVADLQEIQHPARRELQAHLDQTVSVVEVSFGDSLQEAAAEAIARSAAACIATRFGGIVREPDQSWWRAGDDGYRLIEGSPAPVEESSPPTLPYASPKTAAAPKSNPRSSVSRPSLPGSVNPSRSARVGWKPQMPVNCPSCNQALFTRQTRPHPRLTATGKLVVAVAASITTIIYLTGFLIVRLSFHIPSVIVAAVIFPFAIAPGVAVGIIANKMPKTFLARCGKCGWKERFTWGKLGG